MGLWRGSGWEVWSIPPGLWCVRSLLCVCVALHITAFTTLLAPLGLGHWDLGTQPPEAREAERGAGRGMNVCVCECCSGLLWDDSSVSSVRCFANLHLWETAVYTAERRDRVRHSTHTHLPKAFAKLFPCVHKHTHHIISFE